MTHESVAWEEQELREAAQGEQARSKGFVFPPVPPPRGVPIKTAPIRVEVKELHPNGNPAELNIVCHGCERLLFRVRSVQHEVGRKSVTDVVSWPIYQDSYEVERRCQNWRCGRFTSVYLTQRPGYPLEHYGHDGPWHCTCGSYLGRIMGARGRITVKCRHCRRDIRVTIADCMCQWPREMTRGLARR